MDKYDSLACEYSCMSEKKIECSPKIFGCGSFNYLCLFLKVFIKMAEQSFIIVCSLGAIMYLLKYS